MKKIEWTKVEDKQPEDFKNVLICYLTKDEDGEYTQYDFDISWKDPTHEEGWAMGSHEDFKVEYWAEITSPYDS